MATDGDIIRLVGGIMKENREMIHPYMVSGIDEPTILDHSIIDLLNDVHVKVEVDENRNDDANANVAASVSNRVKTIVGAKASTEKIRMFCG